MICYMPFTYLEENHLEHLTPAFGTLTVFSPAAAIVPDHMRAWQRQEEIIIKHPRKVSEARLLSAIDHYNDWAAMHGGSIGDIAGFIKNHYDRFPMVDETNPTQIGHEIRHYGQNKTEQIVDPLFEAALFLSLAQAYDLQHEGMARDLDAINTMEQQMLKGLTGDPHEVDMPLSAAHPTICAPQASTVDDGYMIDHRVRAWSLLALEDAQTPWAYLTINKLVVEQVLAQFPDAMKLLECGAVSIAVRDQLRSLAFGADPNKIEWDKAPHMSDQNSNRLTIYKLTGIRPVDFLQRLAGHHPSAREEVIQEEMPPHTLIGWVKEGQNSNHSP